MDQPSSAPPSLAIRSILSSAEADAGSGGYRLADDVMLLIVHDGSGRLIDLSGEVFAITETGASMLELALQRGEEDACRALATRYGIDLGRMRADMEALFRDLERRRLLVPAGTPHGKSVGRTLSWTVGPLIVLCARLPSGWLALKAWLLISLAFVATRLFGWSHTVRVWDWATSPSGPTANTAPEPSSDLAAIDLAVGRALARHPLPVGCKERALCAWALARVARIPAEIVLGVDLFPFGLHCWCAHGSFIIADRYEGRCDRYTHLLVYR